MEAEGYNSGDEGLGDDEEGVGGTHKRPVASDLPKPARKRARKCDDDDNE